MLYKFIISCYDIIMKDIHHHCYNERIMYDYRLRTTPKKSDFFRHMHEDFEFLYIFESSADLIVENNSYPLQENTLAIIRPAQYHSLKVNHSSPYDRIVLNVPSSMIEETLLPTLDVCVTIADDSPIYRLFHHLKKMDGVFSEAQLLSYAEHVVPLVLLECMTNHKKPAPQEYGVLHKCLRFIEEHIEEPLSVPVIADACFVSSSYLSHLFQKELGIGVKQYVNNKKILYAKRLIDSGLPKTKAAERIGITNYPTFYRLYTHYIKNNPEPNRE